ncbi:MAG: hypothetical protein ACI4XM_01020 [Candidatus Coprovivens sp.]
MSNSLNSIYGISISDLEKDPVQVPNGVYYDFKGFTLFVPDDVDSSTSAFIYYPGSGGSRNDAEYIRSSINDGNSNQIIIIVDDAYSDRASGGARHLQLIENIGAANDAEITNIDSMGFSASGPTTFNTILNTISTYPDSGPHNAVFCDVVGFTVNQEQIDLLVEDEATLLFLEPNGTSTDFERKLAQGGVDVILAWTSGSHAGHVPLNREALQNGIIDFVTGESDELANSDIYKFVTYDINSGEWYEISLDEVAEKFVNSDVADNPFRYYNRLSNMDTELQCNNSYLGSKINTIRTAIKNSNFLSTMSMDYYGSTTQIPNAENEIIQAYFSACAKTLNCLEKDTSKIIQIGNSIDEINDNLKTDAGELNNSINYYTNTPTNTSSSSNSWVSSSSTYNGNSGTYSNTTSNGSYASTASTVGVIGTSGSASSSDIEVTEEISNKEFPFLSYNELYTDVDQKIIVYKNLEEKYKLVIHYEGDKILGIDYYYQYPTRNNALEAVELLKEKYGDTCSDVLREANTIKVEMKETSYSNMTTTDFVLQCEKSEDMVKLVRN